MDVPGRATLNTIRWRSVDAARGVLSRRAPTPLPDISVSRMRLERILTENVLPFWRRETFIDEAHGGYRLNHGPTGRSLGDAEKAVITQARTAWFFSRLSRSPFAESGDIERARHGIDFLLNRLWDSKHGGFYWAVAADGAYPTLPLKHLCAQAFGLFALTEYGHVSGSREAIDKAHELFEQLERVAHDDVNEGYREFFTRDWNPGPDGVPGYLEPSKSDGKSMNTHLHVMEALATYVPVAETPVARERLAELIHVQSQLVFRSEFGTCSENHALDWSPDAHERRTSYGHDVENVWLLMQANESLGRSDAGDEALYRSLVDNALKYGEDRVHGGFFESGPYRGPADWRQKTWWVQAEALAATLRIWNLTGDGRYGEAFARTLDWVEMHQVDWEHGDWFRSISRGTGRGNKADHWKSPYHNGRALLECIELLDRMARA